MRHKEDFALFRWLVGRAEKSAKRERVKARRSFCNIYKAGFYYACHRNTTHSNNFSPSSLPVKKSLNRCKVSFQPWWSLCLLQIPDHTTVSEALLGNSACLMAHSCSWCVALRSAVLPHQTLAYKCCSDSQINWIALFSLVIIRCELSVLKNKRMLTLQRCLEF